MSFLLKVHHWPPYLVIAVSGLLLGAVIVGLPALIVLIVLASIPLVFAFFRRPELALLGILVGTSTLIGEESMLRVSIGVGRLYITDFVLLSLLGLIAWRWLLKSDFRINRTPLDWPLIGFFGVALLSTLIGILTSTVELKMAISGIRLVTYYLTFFVVTNLIREDRQVSLLVKGLLLLATMVAAAMALQLILGKSIPILPGRVETLTTQGREYLGITRMLPPGQSLVLVALTSTAASLILWRFRPIRILTLLQCGLLLLAVLLTFTRGFWAGTGLAILLLVLLARGPDRRRVLGWGLAMVTSALVIVLILPAKPDSLGVRLTKAAFDRLESLSYTRTYQGQESTWRWRYFEYEYALPQIASHPVVGLGLGAKYRPFIPGIDWEGFDGRGYVHNGHLWILLGTGLSGYLFFLWLSVAYLIRGFKSWRIISNPQTKGLVLAMTLAYLAVLIGSIGDPMLMNWSWTPVVGVMMGINEVLIRNALPEGKPV